MKSALSLTLIASLVGSAPVAAQDRMESTAGPIARAVTREAVRLAADPQSELAGSDWARVRSLVPGTEVIVTIKGARLGKRYIVRADESELVVKVTERGQVETLARTDVVEIGIPVSHHPARTGALIGAATGAVVWLLLCSNRSESVCAPGTWIVFAGIGAGSGVGIGALIGAFSDHMPYVIYRAP